ncbi:MAG: GNAT family N-acetyltransferase [Sphingomonadaceae bacterium]|nr:GNAT family N-acetyltransferase [Sphingomonadaceae bacterium]
MFARTARLLLRPAWREDSPALHHALTGLAAHDHDTPLTIEDVDALIAREQDPLRPELMIFARTYGAPRLVGGIALAGRENTELRFWIARPYWGLGFATEAGHAAVDIARDTLRLPSLRARVDDSGLAAGRVLRKLGFRSVGGGDHRLLLGFDDEAMAA